MRVKLTKWGNCIGLRIPKVFLNISDFKNQTEVDITLRKDRIIIKKVN